MGYVVFELVGSYAVNENALDTPLPAVQERTVWHEAMSRSLFQAEVLTERRLLEYVVLGDNQTAVAFLLASAPDRSAR